MNTLMRSLICLVVTLTLAGVSLGQETKPKPAEKPDDANGVKKELKDPTAPSPKLKDIFNPARTGGKPGAAPVLPKMKLRGLIVVGDKRAAYLDVGGENLLVHAGDMITTLGGRSVQLIDVAALEAILGSARSSEALRATVSASDSGVMRIIAITDGEVIIEAFGGLLVLR